jgi:peptidoglycan/LPS O-acetylase OafA/YrhL
MTPHPSKSHEPLVEIANSDHVLRRANTDLSPKTSRFVTLDALRGIAALMVVLFHAGRVLGAWMPRFGYLAVDLFFILSGFVIAHSYDRRFAAGMGTLEFLSLRAIRLYPLYFIGLVLGVSVATINPAFIDASFGNVGTSFFLNLFGLPWPVEEFQAPGYRVLFPLNLAFWSLFLEFWIANLAFATLWKFLRWKMLFFIIVVSAVGLLLSEKNFYTMDVGSKWNYFAGGFPRVFFSFFSGVAISRVHRLSAPARTLPSWLFIIVLPIILSFPLEDRAAHVYELVCVFIIFPLLIFFGAAATERRPKIGEVLGDASYAIYTIHYPALTIVAWFLTKMALNLNLLVQFCFAAAMVPTALGVGRIDVRLRQRLFRRS